MLMEKCLEHFKNFKYSLKVFEANISYGFETFKKYLNYFVTNEEK